MLAPWFCCLIELPLCTQTQVNAVSLIRQSHLCLKRTAILFTAAIL